MTRDDIIRMAREARAHEHYVSESDDVPWSVEFSLTNLEAFAALVADAARGDYTEGWEEGYKAGVKAEREQMQKEGWRQCAVGQKTTQFCAEAEKVVQQLERQVEDFKMRWRRS